MEAWAEPSLHLPPGIFNLRKRLNDFWKKKVNLPLNLNLDSFIYKYLKFGVKFNVNI